MWAVLAGYFYGKSKGQREATELLADPELIAHRELEKEQRKEKWGYLGVFLIAAILLAWLVSTLLGITPHVKADRAAAEAAWQFSYDEGGASTDSVRCKWRGKSYVCRVEAGQKISEAGYGVTPCAVYRVSGVPPVAMRIAPSDNKPNEWKKVCRKT